jgi:endonuclease YncB( thermonuclease family)
MTARLSAVDGDSLKRGAGFIRLYNIDAPEREHINTQRRGRA